MPLATFWVFLCIVLGIALAQILPVAKRMHAKFTELTQQLRRRLHGRMREFGAWLQCGRGMLAEFGGTGDGAVIYC
jgi:hypothetical protein